MGNGSNFRFTDGAPFETLFGRAGILGAAKWVGGDAGEYGRTLAFKKCTIDGQGRCKYKRGPLHTPKSVHFSA